MSRRIFAWSLFPLVLVLTALGGAHDARAAAAPNDKEVEALIESVLTSDYLNANFKQALEQLDFGKQACSTANGCSPKIRGRLYIAIGTVLAGGLKKVSEAKDAFAIALKEDPTASLFDDFITPEVQKAFNDARSGNSASGGTEETKKGPEKRQPKKTWPGGGGRPPRGWKNGESFFYYNEATKSEGKRDWLDCVDYAQASLNAENRATTRFLAATCEEKAGLWIEAYSDYQNVGDAANKSGLFDVANNAKQRAQTLQDKIPKIVLRKPANVDNLVVKMNDVEVPQDKLNGEIWVNPGARAVKASGKLNGVELEFDQAVDATEFETTTVDIKLGPKGAKGDQVMMRCILGAQNREDFGKCLRKDAGGPSLTIRASTEVAGYHSTDHVDVISPAWVLGVENPTGGWGITGSFLVDVVTAASVDIVATGSPRWRETRYAPTLSGHKKFGDVDVALHGNLSHEPDYLATTAGTSISADLLNKRITPSLGYDFSYDIAGRSGTPYSVYSHKISRHGITAAASFVVNKATVFAATLTMVFEDGDTSKPYRYVPMFTKDVVDRIPAGLSIAAVNKLRLPERILEQVPVTRQRYAVAGLLAHRFSSSTLRAEERLYTDSWGQKASTTELLYFIDATERFRIWPQVRFNVQSGATFFRLAYPVRPTADVTIYQVPTLRTGSRELGPLIDITLGGGTRYAFGEKKNWALSVTGDIVYTRFLDQLFILDRLGVFGATTLEVDFE